MAQRKALLPGDPPGADGAYPPVMSQERSLSMVPCGKARPRVTRHGTHMPTEYVAWKAAFRAEFGAVLLPEDRDIRLSVVVYRPMPRSWSRAKRTSMIGAHCRPGPDADNLAGSIMDALFINDSRVVELHVVKVWAETVQLYVEISVI